MNLSEAMALEAAVFVNPAEFGEVIHLDGLTLAGIVTRAEISMGHGMDMDIPRAMRRLHVETAALPEGFTPSGTLLYEGEYWSVGEATEACGLTLFELSKAL